MASEPLDLDALLAHAEDHRSPHMTVSRDTIRALIARLRAAEAALAEAEAGVSAEVRGLIAECLALNPIVSGDMEKVRVWADVVQRLRALAAAPAEEP